MKLLVQSAMIFFGTLMAAGLVALGEPASGASGRAAASATPAPPVVADARATARDTARPRR